MQSELNVEEVVNDRSMKVRMTITSELCYLDISLIGPLFTTTSLPCITSHEVTLAAVALQSKWEDNVI